MCRSRVYKPRVSRINLSMIEEHLKLKNERKLSLLDYLASQLNI